MTLRVRNAEGCTGAEIEGVDLSRPLDPADLRQIEDALHDRGVTGRKCLYVNWGFTTHIVGEPREESDRLLDHLFELMTGRRFVHVHRWAVGDVLMWDNCSVVHQAIGNYRLPRRRLLYRTIVKGSAPF